nr:translation initiation factor IF-2, mitochondrial isoform X3 [Bombyx mori]
MTVQDVADVLKKDIDHVFKVLNFADKTGMTYTKDTVIHNPQVVRDIVKISGCRFKLVARPDAEMKDEENKDAVPAPPAAEEALRPRPPVVCVMGHVDHGKTTLLDALRDTAVVETEFGGITQHIGAFEVKLPSGGKVTFLDTPGHAAFTSMRSRGAHSTDIVVLVVAADDGVMEQTLESIRMAREANVPILVAINKIDKPGVNVVGLPGRSACCAGWPSTAWCASRRAARCRPCPCRRCAAGTSTRCSRPSPCRRSSCSSAPTPPDRSRASSLKHWWTLGPASRRRCWCGAGRCGAAARWWRARAGPRCALLHSPLVRKAQGGPSAGPQSQVRILRSAEGASIEEAPPSCPVVVLGWRELPAAGDLVLEVASEKRAAEVMRWRAAQRMKEKQQSDSEVIEAKMSEHQQRYRAMLSRKRAMGRYKLKPEGPREKMIKEDTHPALNVIVKGDVDGSVEAILDILDTYDDHERVRLDLVHFGVGQVTPNDLEIAEAFNAIIYAFNVECPPAVAADAKDLNISVRKHNVIYRLVDDVKQEITARIPVTQTEEVIGEANVLQEFMVSEGRRKVPVAGCRCVRGSLAKNALYKIIRGQETVFEGKLVSMKHLKEEVPTIKRDQECGLKFDDPEARVQPGDTVLCYRLRDVAPRTDWDPGF